MHAPSFRTLADAFGVDFIQLVAAQPEHVSVNAQTLRVLLQFVALAADFDEAYYLAENPDLAAALESGLITDARLHYVQAGFFEGRRASKLNIDQAWYRKIYPDVDAAIREGVIASPESHFAERGEIEWRAPNEASLPWTRAWAEALSRPQRKEPLKTPSRSVPMAG